MIRSSSVEVGTKEEDEEADEEGEEERISSSSKVNKLTRSILTSSNSSRDHNLVHPPKAKTPLPTSSPLHSGYPRR